jgi:hypothetical protein
MRCSSEDQDKAKQGLQEFCQQFNVERQIVDDIAGLGFWFPYKIITGFSKNDIH